jgi:hypothetical protein
VWKRGRERGKISKKRIKKGIRTRESKLKNKGKKGR